MERIVIPGKATYSPVALTDLFMGAPIVSRLLLGATLPGQVIAAASVGYYVGSAARDQWARRRVRPVDFAEAFGADVFDHRSQPADSRHWEVVLLGKALNDGYVAERPERPELARRVDAALTQLIASVTGQEIVTSTQIRSYGIGKLVMPQALGACDPISGDVAIFQDLGLIEPHVIAHEFAHRKGYLKELHAQVLAFLALRSSGDPLLVQSARLERLYRQLVVMQRTRPEAPSQLIDRAMLRPELRSLLLPMLPEPTEKRRLTVFKKLYDKRMRLTGQNGLTDYDEGFLNVLWTFSRSDAARMPPALAAI